MENKEEVKNENVTPEEVKSEIVAPEVTTNEKANQEELKENSEQNPINQDESLLQEPVEKPTKIVNPDAFNSDERVLYEIKEEKQGNPIVVLVLFIIIVTFILNLNNINNFVQKKLGHTYSRTSNVGGPSIAIEDSEDEEIHKFHDATNRVKIGDLDIFQVDTTNQGDEYFVTFTITNNGSTTYTYDKKYYLTLYEDNRVLYRALIFSYNLLAAHASAELRLVINQNAYDKANNYKLEEISTSLYEEKELNQQIDDYKVLTCKYRNDIMEYYFKENMLEKINETYNVTYDEPQYEALYEEYNILSQKYNSMNGIESIFYGRPDSFEVINKFTLSEIQDYELSSLNVYRYFKFRENSKIVAFEMTSMGYTCS